MKMDVEAPYDIVGRVGRHVRTQPDNTAFVFIQRLGEEPGSMTWGDLWSRAQAIAAELPDPSGTDPLGCLLFCRKASRFVPALLAIWMRGGVAIPGSSALTPRLIERNIHIIKAAKPDVILHDLQSDDIEKLRAVAEDADLMTLEKAMQGSSIAISAAGGLLQFTSGTTSKPKPVLLRHQAIVHNTDAICNRFELTETSVGLHWLPLHHDMGLVGAVISAFSMGGLSVLMHPAIFIQDPLAWFRGISQWRATITSAPNFAYARLVEAALKHPPTDMDLSSLRNLIIGGEPVHRSTIDGLRDQFSPLGLAEDAIAPSYGMAETTLLISSGKRAGGPRMKQINGQDVVGLGRPVPGLSVTIEKDGKPCAEGVVGSVVVRGESLGRIISEGTDWRSVGEDRPLPDIKTGDFGFLDHGEIFLTGRSSNRIIIRGKNVFAEDVEQIALGVVDGCVPGGAAAFAISDHATERLCLMIEMPRSAPFDHLPRLNSETGRILGIKLHRVIVLTGACLPRTSSGKIQRGRARDLLADGAFDKRIRLDVLQGAN
jgi:acyl-CoA synthetase (AMP-forming)/AMP-acid ligase II